MIVETISDPYEFWNWLKNSDNYSNNFSVEGAKALQSYLDNLSDDCDTKYEFDPIAWCCEFTEYNNVSDAYKEQYGNADDLPESQRRTDKAQQLEWFQDNTQVIEMDNGCIIIQDF